jgi:hypothetical protein
MQLAQRRRTKKINLLQRMGLWFLSDQLGKEPPAVLHHHNYYIQEYKRPQDPLFVLPCHVEHSVGLKGA